MGGSGSVSGTLVLGEPGALVLGKLLRLFWESVILLSSPLSGGSKVHRDVLVISFAKLIST
jgi:hypothetical protein